MSVFTDGKTNGPGICWPDGKRIAVMVTFDFDAEFLRISRAESKGTSIGLHRFFQRPVRAAHRTFKVS